MPWLKHTNPIALTTSTIKNKHPLWINADLGRTGEVADGVHIGNRLVHTQNHLLHYRLNGMIHWSPYPLQNPSGRVPAVTTGHIYIPVRRPTPVSGADIAIAVSIFCNENITDSVESYVKWRLGLSGDQTTLFSETFTTGTFIGELRYVLEYAVTADVECIDLEISNIDVISVSAWNLPQRMLASDEYYNAPGDCAPGRYIVDDTWSMKGLIAAIGDGTAATATMERMTRRVFFNQSHMKGSYISSALGDHDLTENMLGSMQFEVRCRDFGDQVTGDAGNDIYCYPAAVIKSKGHGAGKLATVELIFYSTSSTASWTYTVQTGDPIDTPFLVTPASTGSSSANGLLVYHDADDTIEVRGHVARGPSADEGELTLLGWALFEGRAWT